MESQINLVLLNLIRVSKGCDAPALYHILMCKLICNNNIWYERSTKGAFDTLI